MGKDSELLQIKTSWAFGTLDNVLDSFKNLNLDSLWYDAKRENDESLQIGAIYLSALLLKGEGKKLYDIVTKYGLLGFDNIRPYNYVLLFFNNDIGQLFLAMKQNLNMEIIEPTNLYNAQSKPDDEEWYPETSRAADFLNRLFLMHDKETVLRYLYNEAYSSDDYLPAAALALYSTRASLYQQAVLAYIRCTNLNPNKAVFWGEAGIAAWKGKAVVTSLYLLNQAVKLDPNNPQWYYYKVLAYTGLLFYFKNISETDPHIMTWYGRITAAEREINFQLAEKYISYNTPEPTSSAIKKFRMSNDEIMDSLGIELNPLRSFFS